MINYIDFISEMPLFELFSHVFGLFLQLNSYRSDLKNCNDEFLSASLIDDCNETQSFIDISMDYIYNSGLSDLFDSYARFVFDNNLV